MSRLAVYCGTRNLYHHMVTAAKSLFCHNGADRVLFITEDFTFPEPLPPCVQIMNVSGQLYFPVGTPNYKSMYTYMALMRIPLTKLLPNTERILYMDVDTIVCDDDISCIWRYDLKDNYFAAVPETIQYTVQNRKQPYYNTGVTLMNLALMREHKVDDTMIQILNTRWVQFPDQDTMNSVCYGHILTLPDRYNVSVVTGERNQNAPAIVRHYAARHPWYTNPDYLRYENMTWDEVLAGREVNAWPPCWIL